MSATESVEANKAVVRRLVEEAWNGNRPDLLDELCWPDIVEHLPRFGTTEGLSEPRQTAELFRAAFPDLRVVTHDLFGERDLVAARGTLHGTQARELFGVAPMGRSVAIDGVLMARLRGGKIAELWLHYDAEALVGDLIAAIPPPWSDGRLVLRAHALIDPLVELLCAESLVAATSAERLAARCPPG